MPTLEDPKLYLLTPPQRQGEAAQYGLTPAHLAYRIGRGPHLFRTQLPTPIQGGVMVLDDSGFDGEGGAEPFCGEVIRECTARKLTGAFFDLEGPPTATLTRALTLLVPSFAKRGWDLYVPCGHADDIPGVKVVVPSALSGGSLRHRLREVIDAFGLERVVLGLQWACEDFTLPAANGSGRRMSGEELAQLRTTRRPSVYFSGDLCAHYFTYMPTGGAPHFILFDDAISMAKKLELAREMGIREAFLPYPEDPEQLSALLCPGQKETP